MSVEFKPREALEMMLGHLGFMFEIKEEQRSSGLTLSVNMRDPGRMIGKMGKTLDDLQYLLNRILSTDDEDTPVVTVDIGGYRLQQQTELLERAAHAAKRVQEIKKSITLEPMNSFDRRLVHNLIQSDFPDLETTSQAMPHSKLKRLIIRTKGEKDAEKSSRKS